MYACQPVLISSSACFLWHQKRRPTLPHTLPAALSTSPAPAPRTPDITFQHASNPDFAWCDIGRECTEREEDGS
eukprot:3669332-Rhodomonas_salina.1